MEARRVRRQGAPPTQRSSSLVFVWRHSVCVDVAVDENIDGQGVREPQALRDRLVMISSPDENRHECEKEEREREKRERVAAKERSMDRTNSCVAAVYSSQGR